jgi:hypothetical protein
MSVSHLGHPMGQRLSLHPLEGDILVALTVMVTSS